MKNLAKQAVLVAAVCLLNSVALGQQKSIRKTRKPTEPPKIVCSVAAVPKGMVIVGYKDNVGCTSGRELMVKRPAASETVCANSPMPTGYTVESINGSLDCKEAGANPLTNALVITRAGEDLSASSTTNSEPVYTRSTSRREITVRVSRASSSDDEESPKSPLEERAAKINAEAKLENAASRGEILVGMTTSQVAKAWGRPHSTTGNTTYSGGGTETIWSYYKKGQSVRLSFKNDVLTRWVWEH